MALSSPKIKWCIVRLGEDMNWWVEELSDSIHWDVDGLSIVDPRQFAHIIDLVDPLRDYGFIPDILESAFSGFSIEQDLGKGRVRLKAFREPLLTSDEQLFAIPDIIDEEKGPYADFLDHVTKLRLKMLNDLIDFEQHLTIEELEEEIREAQNNDFMEGRATHIFEEITSILEYVPEGYELDIDEDEKTKTTSSEEAIGEDFPDLDVEETIEQDETMKWDEDEDENKDENENEDESYNDLENSKKEEKE